MAGLRPAVRGHEQGEDRAVRRPLQHARRRRIAALRAADPAIKAIHFTRSFGHQAALTEAARELDAFAAAWSSREIPATVAAVPLRGAVHALEALVGVVDVEDVLSRVFSSFCVGK